MLPGSNVASLTLSTPMSSDAQQTTLLYQLWCQVTTIWWFQIYFSLYFTSIGKVLNYV